VAVAEVSARGPAGRGGQKQPVQAVTVSAQIVATR